jgi:hypothetical protein
MSDEPIRLPAGVEPEHRVPVGIIDHYCEHPGCKEWGYLGFARGREASRNGSAAGKWRTARPI